MYVIQKRKTGISQVDAPIRWYDHHEDSAPTTPTRLTLVGLVVCQMLCSGLKSSNATALKTPKTRQVNAASQCGRWRGPSKEGVSLSFGFELSALRIFSGNR